MINLTQEQKDTIWRLHYKIGAIEELEYYYELSEEYEGMREEINKQIKRTCEEFNIDYNKVINGNYEWDVDEFDEFMLNLMANLNETFNVGLYDTPY